MDERQIDRNPGAEADSNVDAYLQLLNSATYTTVTREDPCQKSQEN